MKTLSTLLSAAAAAVTVFTLAPEARADGFFITLSNGVTSQRLWGAVFDTTTSTPVAYATSGMSRHITVTPVHIEIDDWYLGSGNRQGRWRRHVVRCQGWSSRRPCPVPSRST